MKLNCLCYCRGETILRGKVGIEGIKKRVDFYFFLGEIPFKPAFMGQLVTLVPLEPACANVWRLGQLRERN